MDCANFREEPGNRLVALLFENMPHIVSLFKEGSSGWIAAGEARGLTETKLEPVFQTDAFLERCTLEVPA